jgi:hypothetical protein
MINLNAIIINENNYIFLNMSVTNKSICHSHTFLYLRNSCRRWELHKTIASLLGIVLSNNNPLPAINLHYTIVTWFIACQSFISDVNIDDAVFALCFVADGGSIFVHLNIKASARLTIISKSKGILNLCHRVLT